MLFGKSSKAESQGQENTAGFTGRWLSTFGPLTMEADGNAVRGRYRFSAIDGELQGSVAGARLTFRYKEPAVSGEGWFELVRPDRFRGRWRPDGAARWFDWTGERGFEGIWNSTFGPLRLVREEAGRVIGFYELNGPCGTEGNLEGNRLSFRYREPHASGEGSFILADDQLSFSGEWRQEGRGATQPWEGARMLPRPGLAWLVVMEAHWQRYLSEREYSFGAMLDEFFARLPHVNVSHRFFTDEHGLRQWCRSVMYLPEPVCLVVAGHATAEGLDVLGRIIPPGAMAEDLRFADSLSLVHFSSCLIMNGEGGKDPARDLVALGRFPVSGYGTTVNWAASAIIEFLYLDLVLEQRLAPAEAARELVRLMPFAGDAAPEGSPYPAAGFRLLEPGGGS